MLKWILKCRIQLTTMLSWLQCFIHMYCEDGTKWLPFSRRYQNFLKLIFLYGIVSLFLFFKFTLNVFQNFQIQIIVLFYHPALRLIVGVQTPCTACRHYMETISLILLRCEGKSTGHRWIPRTKGKWYRGVCARVWSLLPGYFCIHEPLVCFTACVKRLPPSQWQADSGLVSSWLCAY